MRAPRAGQRGFALVLTLWTVVIVLLLAAALDAWVAARVEQARAIRDRVQDQLDAYSTRATVSYLLGTRRFTRAGLTTLDEESPIDADPRFGELRIDPVGGEITLDGTAYRGLGRIRFALQDQAGQIALNGEETEALTALLRSFGAGQIERQSLLDALADYRDSNELRRLNGAEREEYLAAGEPPPSNFHLASPPELLRVLGWRGWLARHPDFRLHEWLSAGDLTAFNPNAIPESLLARLPGLDAETAAAVAAERRREPFRSVPDLQARVDAVLPLEEDLFRFFPSDSLQLRLWAEGAAQAEVLTLQLLPLGRHEPLQIRSTYRINHRPHDEVHEVPGQLFDAGAPAAR